MRTSEKFKVNKGDEISIYWDGDRKWYSGEVLASDENGNCYILYEDGEQEHLNLSDVKFRVKETNWKRRLRGKRACSLKSIQESLLDIEDRLPTKGVLTTSPEWWESWRNEVSCAVRHNEIKDLATSILQVGEQLKIIITTAWWHSNRTQWKIDVEAAKSVSDIERVVKDLKTKIVDWSIAKSLFGAVDSPDEMEQQLNHLDGFDNSDPKKSSYMVNMKQSMVRSTRGSTNDITEPLINTKATVGASQTEKIMEKSHDSVHHVTGTYPKQSKKRKGSNESVRFAEDNYMKMNCEGGNAMTPRRRIARKQSRCVVSEEDLLYAKTKNDNNLPLKPLERKGINDCDLQGNEQNYPSRNTEEWQKNYDVHGALVDIAVAKNMMNVSTDERMKDPLSDVREVNIGEKKEPTYVLAEGKWNKELECSHPLCVKPLGRSGFSALQTENTNIELVNESKVSYDGPDFKPNVYNDATRSFRKVFPSPSETFDFAAHDGNGEKLYESRWRVGSCNGITSLSNSSEGMMDDNSMVVEMFGKVQDKKNTIFDTATIISSDYVASSCVEMKTEANQETVASLKSSNVLAKRNRGSWKVEVPNDSRTLQIFGSKKHQCAVHSVPKVKSEAMPSNSKLSRKGKGTMADDQWRNQTQSVEASGNLDAQRSTSTDINQICNVCKIEGADNLLLLCDGKQCLLAFHTFCLQPPLLMVPDGDWLCPYCDRSSIYFEMLKRNCHYPSKKVEKIVGRREFQDENEPGQVQFEYLIKWASMAHHHDTWVPDNWIMCYDRARVMNFHRKLLLAGGSIPNFVDERKPEWLKIDRVIACREKLVADSNINELGRMTMSSAMNCRRYEFLVKWMGLDYCDVTWEDGLDEELLGAVDKLVQRHRKANETGESGVTYLVGLSLKEQPNYLKGGILHSYQLEGLKWLLHNFENRKNVVLADEMGLGKTVQAIAFISCMKKENLSKKPVLVIAPKSILSGWDQEFRQWAPYLNCIIYQGDKLSRSCIREHEFYTSNKQVLFDVLVTNYEIAITDNSVLQKFEWASIIVDEGHRIKNFRSRLGNLLRLLVTDFRLLMTGTPLQNSLTELFALLHFLDPSEVPDPEVAACEFTQISMKHGNSGNEGSLQGVSRIHELLQPRMLRRLKSEVLQELIPGKKIVEVPCALTAAQRLLYLNILKRNYKVLNQGIHNGQKRSLNTLLVDLKMCCNHPYLFPGQENISQNGQNAFESLVGSSGKLQCLEKLLPRLKANGHRVLLFSQMTKMLDLLEEFLTFLGFAYCRLDGSTSISERQQHIKNFSESSDIFIFLISTRAGGLGINLANADTVIIYDPDFNPFVDLQAQARAHRIGQENPVVVYQLITKCSIEEKILQRSRSKLALEDIVMNRCGTETFKELHEILRHGVHNIVDEKNIAATSVNYTDADIERLLDRDIDVNQDTSFLHGYLGSVRGQVIEDANVKLSSTQKEWETLLGPSMEGMTKEELGRGKRRRREVKYDSDTSENDDNYSPSSSEDSSSMSDYSIDKTVHEVSS